jgi:negative regulator of flagellin synthesis FlgM
MKISDLNRQSGSLAYINQSGKPDPNEKTPAAVEGQGKTASSDRVELSARSREIKKIHDVIEMTPDVRAEKVAALKAQVDKGEYQVKPEEVADRMVKEFMGDLNK